MKNVISSNSESSIKSSATRLKIMVFDLAIGGHHPSYIRYLITYWDKNKFDSELFILVSPDFLEVHSNVVESSSSSVNFIAISSEELEQIKNSKKIIKRAFLEWSIYCNYANAYSIDHGLLLYFDHLQLPILCLGHKFPSSISGIYFRPSFHYQKFNNTEFSFKDYLRGLRQKILLILVLHSQNISNLFCLDPYFSDYIKFGKIHQKIRYIPDPIDLIEPPYSGNQRLEELRTSLGVDQDRKIFLVYGSIDERKGISNILKSTELLSEEEQKQICLLIVGKTSKNILKLIKIYQTKIAESYLKVQLININEYVSVMMESSYLKISDIVLLTYKKHVGMSGVLLLAALFKKTVLASNYGLIGKLVNDYELGMAISSESCREIAIGLKTTLNSNYLNSLDLNKLEIFSNMHDFHDFAHIIFQNMLFPKVCISK